MKTHPHIIGMQVHALEMQFTNGTWRTSHAYRDKGHALRVLGKIQTAHGRGVTHPWRVRPIEAYADLLVVLDKRTVVRA